MLMQNSSNSHVAKANNIEKIVTTIKTLNFSLTGQVIFDFNSQMILICK
jgi:hypothetical protein